MDDVASKEVGIVRCVCPESYTWRVGLEIMSSLTTNGVLRFGAEQLRIVHTNSPGTIALAFTYPESKLLRYEVKLNDKSMGEIYADVNLAHMIEACRSYEKRESVSMSCTVVEGGIVKSIELLRDNNSVDGVKCDIPNSALLPMYIDLRQQYYPSCKPTTKLIASRFAKIMTNFKTRRCTKIAFVLHPVDGVIINGFCGNKNLSAAVCDDEGSEEDEQALASPATEDADSPEVAGSPDNTAKEYSIYIKFSNISGWINKISRLSPQRSVILVYLQPNCPLILEAQIGCIGHATLAFSNEE